MKRCAWVAAVAGWAAWAAGPALATTKGLNQIVTPDIQPAGELSISYQRQNRNIGNASQLQLELGLTDRAEVALFRGLSPDRISLAAEVGLVQRPPYLLSAGFLNWSSGGSGSTSPQPFVVGGIYRGRQEIIAGWNRAGSRNECLLGYCYEAAPKALVQTDYLSGPGNAVTLGFTYAITPDLSLNPAVYLPNDAPRTLQGYAVLSWTVRAFR